MSYTIDPQDTLCDTWQIHTPLESDLWRNAVIDGDLPTIKQLMQIKLIDANFGTKDGGENPLITILKHDLCQNHEKQTEVAKYLIEQGCYLGPRDHFWMLPADYAMFSTNYETAKMIVRATIIREENTNRPDEDRFIPNMRSFFLTTHDETVRRERFDVFIANQKRMGEDFIEAILSDDLELAQSMTGDQQEYWENPSKAKFEMMPKPPKTFDLDRQQGDDWDSANHTAIIRAVTPNIPGIR